MDVSGADWRALFERWPDSMPRSGIVVTTFAETIAFADFLLGEGILLLERERPDSLGARKVMLAWESIASVKLTDAAELAAYEPLGFSRGM